VSKDARRWRGDGSVSKSTARLRARMSGPSPSRKGRLTAACMLVCALIIFGLAVTGVLQLRWASPPVARITAK
jgi:hypothetical protein